MNEALLTLTAAALSGVAARNRGGHGVAVRPAQELAAEAVELARATLEQLETDPPRPQPKAKK